MLCSKHALFTLLISFTFVCYSSSVFFSYHTDVWCAHRWRVPASGETHKHQYRGTYYGHYAWVTGVALIDKILVSTSHDGVIRLWDAHGMLLSLVYILYFYYQYYFKILFLQLSSWHSVWLCLICVFLIELVLLLCCAAIVLCML